MPANQTSSDLMILPMEGSDATGWMPGKPEVFLNTSALETQTMFSRTVAGSPMRLLTNWVLRTFLSVRFPTTLINGRSPRQVESADMVKKGNQLLFRMPEPDSRVMVVSYTVVGDSFKADKPQVWSPVKILARVRQRSFDIHPDGERIVAAVAP
jgi:hypothetical protein